MKGYLSNDVGIFSENFSFFTNFEELLWRHQPYDVKKIETYVKLPHFCDKLVETELKDIFLFRSNSLKVLIFRSYGWSISENGMMSANISRDSQYFHHIYLKYLRWATFVLSLKVAAFIILEKSRGAFLPPSRFKEDPPKSH